MRLYGKRFFRNMMDTRVSDKRETRDAILWDIYPDDRYCRVKVAGSPEFVKAYFPRSLDKIPFWMKPGTAIRVGHVGGSRSRIEVVSIGLVLPAPTSGTLLPPLAARENTIMSGMNIQGTPTPGESVYIPAGTYRIDGVLYNFDAATSMGEGGQWYMGEGGDMSGSYLILPVDPVVGDGENYWFRYDAFVIGADGVVDYIKGEEWQYEGMYASTEGPQEPSVPDNHVLIGDFILRYVGNNVVTSQDVGRAWTRPAAQSLEMDEPDVAARSIRWGGEGQIPAAKVQNYMSHYGTVSVKDQYGLEVGLYQTGDINELEFSYVDPGRATGMVSFGSPGQNIVPGETFRGDLGLGFQKHFTVWRDWTFVEVSDPGMPGYPGYYEGTPTDLSPTLKIQVVSGGVPTIMTVYMVPFLDDGDAPMFA